MLDDQIITKRNVFLTRLMVIIVLGYLVIFAPSRSVDIYICYFYLAFYLATNLVIKIIFDRLFDIKLIVYILIVFDSVMVCLGIYLSGRVGTDFYLIYFFVIGMASLSIDLRFLMINTTLFTLLYGWLLYEKNLFSGQMGVSYALRLPFIFIIALFFGYIVNTIMKNRDRDLRESEEKFRSLVESMDDLVYVVDQNANYLSVSEKVVFELGVPQSQIIGKPFSDFHSSEDASTFAELVRKVFSTEKGVQYEHHDPRNGRWSLVNLSPIKNTNASGVKALSAVSRDITMRIQSEKKLQAAYEKLKLTQDQLIQNEKMAAMGRLASSMAHQIRNPLEIILMGVEYLGHCVDRKTERMEKGIQKIENAVNRTNKIITDILAFSRPSDAKFENIDVCRVLDDTLELVGHRIVKNSIHIEKHYASPRIEVHADGTLLEQVFLNLLTNAVDAMPQGGAIRVSARIKAVDDKDSKAGRRQSDYFRVGGNAIVVDIEDTGMGIPEELLPRIFEPFWTTREAEKGTGLGLSLAHLIVDRHRGTISVKSEINRGTTFTMKLQPATAETIPFPAPP